MSSPLLEVKDLQVTVGEEQKVLLDGLNLTIYPGETHVLMGHNGAGKSTTLKTISGLLHPKTGDVLYKGKSIKGVRAHKIVEQGNSVYKIVR